MESNTPHPSTAHRGQGFNMGLVATLEKADDIKVYADHPAHLARPQGPNFRGSDKN
ncbi:uncharacterized protein PV06_09889 [Exophiala oligosperma]|uniref:Stress-response A/B barrel domain-containing protein n=1 Tax=Exophiala oligosperma TaxID=215243 RepID=A0A0D2D6B9_9EURO|nr:uncharacterized protein PV06_09889 [Exophiala oligosperma]KIW37910.1 hypothetical protein PV06_09889 [Exophiala oligosperma]